MAADLYCYKDTRKQGSPQWAVYMVALFPQKRRFIVHMRDQGSESNGWPQGIVGAALFYGSDAFTVLSPILFNLYNF